MPEPGLDLLRSLQKDAVDDGVAVSRLLRGAKVLAARLAYSPLETWVERELNGYAREEDLPVYRILHGLESRGTFVGSFGRQLKNGLIPRDIFPTEVQSLMGKVTLSEGVAVYESLVRDAQGQNTSTLSVPWPDRTLRLMSSNIYDDMNCLEAHQVLPVSGLVGLLDRVRTATLTFSLEVERINPGAAEARAGSASLPDQDLAEIYKRMLTKRL